MKRITCDFDKKLGKIKPQHGIVNYPPNLCYTDFAVDAADAQRSIDILNEIDVPFIRLKEPNSKGYGKCLEVPFIFRDFSKDENDPDNYYFYNTNDFIKEGVKPGRTVIYRLGAPREYWNARYNKKPEDYEKFATVCVNIIKHFNKGWGNGMKAGITHWEIWNRADDKLCWPDGTAEDYYKLYGVVASRIKEAFPRLKIGGPAAAFCGGDNAFLKGFLAFVKDNNVPCDFVSWSYWGEDPAEAARQAKAVRTAVRDAGLKTRVSIYNDEWNCMTVGKHGFLQVPHVRDAQGGAFAAAFMIGMQKARMDGSTYYEADMDMPMGGLVGQCRKKPLPALYALLGFSRLYRLGARVKTATVGKNVYAMAAEGKEKRAILISVYEDKKNDVEIRTGMSGNKRVWLLNSEKDFEEVLDTADETFTVTTKGFSIIFIEIE